jgi:NADH-quinone oxidoreductase subunit G
MAIIQINDRNFQANPQDNLLQVCLSHGFDLPYFCWHPALGSVGACRQCAVKQFSNTNDATGRVVMACMTPASDGTRISISDPDARAFRASVIEWMMTNHPHDCPVCEEGGECHLQDMTVMTGHAYRRYRFTKRTHHNQYLGPFIKHEMNRCIACYRCVRFYRDYAGGRDLDVYAAHNDVYFGRDEDGVLESEFSGNLIEVCPTGVFTDKTLSAAYNRKWDLRSVPSVCAHCGVGCNISLSERGGKVRRILNRFNGAVNGYFLCDRGRFGYGFTNTENRPRTPLFRDHDGSIRPIAKANALKRIAKLFDTEGKIIGIGSPRASLEANFALRMLVGAEAFYSGVSVQEARCFATIIENFQHGSVKIPTLDEIEMADAILIFGEDIANTAPRVALALRQAVRTCSIKIANQLKISHWHDMAVREAAQDIRSPVFIAFPTATRLDDIAAELYRAAPDDITQLGFAILHRIDVNAPAVEGLSEKKQALAEQITDVLLRAKRPLIISGCQLGSEVMLHVASGIAQALKKDDRVPGIIFAAPECNSFGLALLQNGNVQDALSAAADKSVSGVIVLENDLYRRTNRLTVDTLFESPTTVIVLDNISTETTRKADIVLPSASFAECEGTLINLGGRAQRSFQAVIPKDDVQPSWIWLRDISCAAERNPLGIWQKFDDVVNALASSMPVFSAISGAAPPNDFRIAGSRIRTEPHRYSGRTAVDVGRTMHEPKADVAKDAPFSSTMEGYYGQMPASLIPFFWTPGWNSGQSLHKFQNETGDSLRGGNPGVRILEPHGGDGTIRPLATIPGAFVREPDRWLVVPRQHIFGSEELSAKAPAIMERSELPSLSLNADDAKILGVKNGTEIEISFDSGRYRLPIILAPELPSGVAAMSFGFSGVDFHALPDWARLQPAAIAEPVL